MPCSEKATGSVGQQRAPILDRKRNTVSEVYRVTGDAGLQQSSWWSHLGMLKYTLKISTKSVYTDEVFFLDAVVVNFAVKGCLPEEEMKAEVPYFEFRAGTPWRVYVSGTSRISKYILVLWG